MILLSVPSHDMLCADFALSLCNLAVYSAMSGVKNFRLAENARNAPTNPVTTHPARTILPPGAFPSLNMPASR